MASSHCEQGQDKTVLSSCLVLSAVWTEFATVADSFQYVGDRTVLSCLRCERIWEQDKTQFTRHFETGQNCFQIFSRTQSPIQFTPRTLTRQDKTRQDSLVLSMFMVWTSHQSPCTRYDSKPMVLNHQYFVQCKYFVQLHFVSRVKNIRDRPCVE